MSRARPSDEPQQPVTIYDVAARAGVSIATVSHALNRPERVAEHTRQRVLDTAESLGFVPRGRGRSVRTLHRIAVSGPLTAHSSYLPRLLGVLERAVPNTDVVVVDDPSPRNEPLLDRIPARGPFDGVIVMGAEPTPRLANELNEAGVPVVLLDRSSGSFSSVVIDDEAGGTLVAEHVLGLRPELVGWVSPAPVPSALVTNGELRLRGFTRRLRAAGYAGELPWTICEDSFEGGKLAAAALLSGPNVPDTVFALHDVIAAGVLTGLSDAGVPPGEIRVIGYDDLQTATQFSLTTVHQPFRESGRAALDLLRELRADPERPVTRTVLLPELVTRSSTAWSPDASDDAIDTEGGRVRE